MATENKVETRSPAPTASSRGSWWSRTADSRTAYLYILPAGLVMIVITLYPLVYQVWMSFTSFGIRNLRFSPFAANDPDIVPQMVGLQNYLGILTGEYIKPYIPTFDFWRILFFNLWWAISNVVVHIVLGVLIAVLLNVEGLWFKKLYRALFILPVVVPPMIIGTVWRNLFDTEYGAFNKVLTPFIGIFVPGFKGIPWLDNNAPDIGPLPLAYFALLTANIWLGWPLNAVVATSALQSIPKDLYEAAHVDGATGRQQFFNVTVPLLKVAMIPFAMFGFITTFNLFHLSYFMSQGGPFGKTELLVTQVYKIVQGTSNPDFANYGVAAAFSVYMFLILLTLSLITNRVTKATQSGDL
jgi:arabinogalactan oligomer / maltooligosaccharide transport system permease protein